jgi:hypothetical protein
MLGPSIPQIYEVITLVEKSALESELWYSSPEAYN